MQIPVFQVPISCRCKSHNWRAAEASLQMVNMRLLSRGEEKSIIKSTMRKAVRQKCHSFQGVRHEVQTVLASRLG